MRNSDNVKNQAMVNQSTQLNTTRRTKSIEQSTPKKAITSSFLLRAMPLFSGLPESILIQLASCAERINYPRGVKIIHSGEKSSCLYVIVNGSVKISIHANDGRENILSTIGSYEFFGEMALIDDNPRSADVITLVPTEVLKIERSDFLNCIRDNFDVAMEIIVSLTKRLRNADRKIACLALLSVEERVKLLLQDYSVLDNEGNRVIKLRLSRQNMAKMLGASREMVSRVMRELENTRYIYKNGNEYYLSAKDGDNSIFNE